MKTILDQSVFCLGLVCIFPPYQNMYGYLEKVTAHNIVF